MRTHHSLAARRAAGDCFVKDNYCALWLVIFGCVLRFELPCGMEWNLWMKVCFVFYFLWRSLRRGASVLSRMACSCFSFRQSNDPLAVPLAVGACRNYYISGDHLLIKQYTDAIRATAGELLATKTHVLSFYMLQVIAVQCSNLKWTLSLINASSSSSSAAYLRQLQCKGHCNISSIIWFLC